MTLTQKQIQNLKSGDVLKFVRRDGSTIPFIVSFVSGFQVWGDVENGIGLFSPSLKLLTK